MQGTIRDYSVNVYSKSSTNIWNFTFKITYTYNGDTYTNYLGNYQFIPKNNFIVGNLFIPDINIFHAKTLYKG